MNGIATRTLDANATDLIQVATNDLPRCCGLRIPTCEISLLMGLWAFHGFQLFIFSLLSLSVFYAREIYKPFCKNLVGIHEQSHHRELRSTRCIRQISFGGDSGKPLCPCVSTRGLNLLYFLLFFTDLNFVFVPPRMERKTCRFGVIWPKSGCKFWWCCMHDMSRSHRWRQGRSVWGRVGAGWGRGKLSCWFVKVGYTGWDQSL